MMSTAITMTRIIKMMPMLYVKVTMITPPPHESGEAHVGDANMTENHHAGRSQNADEGKYN